ncbi:site-specific integrase [Actinomycetospora endophytica]|uniref:Site-specific integrase n=1 Tax=Actinomycetospora endophytica TaxID=2291215 RepID=A0ABS8PII8_9PSEU|nr:site-specific integrase [Actinomycetospora endophytica]MCD2198066.1 site-specific integrase [Actinomycetospora endophytica]
MSGQRRRSNGEGTIFQRSSDGLWVGSAYVHTSTGEIKRRRVYGNTELAAREKLRKLQADDGAGLPAPDKTYTVGEYLDVWLARVKEEKRATTYRGYESAVRLHIKPLLGRKRLDRLTGADVRQFLARFRAKCLCCANGWDKHRPAKDQCCSAKRCCGRHPTTRQVQYVHAVLRNALSNAIRDELIMRNVAKLVVVPTPKYKRGKGLTVPEVRTLLKEAKASRLHALYVVAATLGLRRGELLGLRWSDIDVEARTVDIAQTVQRVGGELLIGAVKTDASEAPLPLPKMTMRALLAHRDRQTVEREKARECWQDHDLVFCTQIGTPIEPRAVNRDWDKLRARTGFPTLRLHDLRHTVVSLLLALGVPPHVVQAIARHADAEITLAIYAHTNLDQMREAVDLIDWDDDETSEEMP